MIMDHISLPISAAAGVVESSKLRMLNISNGVPSDEPTKLIKTSVLLNYKECMRNHAASIGGHATDGCGEFLPSGEEGTVEALKCAACDCHRNFHRREDPSLSLSHAPNKDRIISRGRNQPNPAANSLALPSDTPDDLQAQACARFMQALNSDRQIVDEELHQEGAEVYSFPESPRPRKRFRTKFSVEQKEQMWVFAEKLGWRIKKEDQAAVKQFCANVGVKRHVLKVWMHNNKHTLGNKPSSSPSPASSHLAAISTDPASHLQS